MAKLFPKRASGWARLLAPEMRPASWLILVLGALPFMACASPGTSSSPATQVVVELTALQHFEKKKDLACEPGKEHWRVAGTPKRGGTFIWSSGALQHIDPTSPGGNAQNQPQVYERLVEHRACYLEDVVMVPGLAKSWEISPDGKIWTLKLRDDVKWQNKPPVNGRAFTSADVAWTIEHHKAGGLLRSAWAPVKYETPDAFTVMLTLPDPDADFLGNVLSERNAFMLPQEVKEQYGDFKSVAIGTGPYMVKSFTPGQRIIEERNPNYRELGVDGKPLPYIDEIDIPVFADYAAEVAAMRSGQIDLNGVTGFFKRDADALLAAGRKFLAYQDVGAQPRGFWMLLNEKPFDDVRVRRALAYAIDGDEVIEGAFQGGAIRTSHLPSAILEYAWPPSKVREKYQPNREQAKQLLQEAGFGPSNPLSFTMKTSTAPRDISGAEVVQNQLRQLGVDVTIEQTNTSASTIVATRAYVTAWGGISPSSMIPDRWMGGFVRCGDSRNSTNLCDPEIDQLSRAQSKELDPVRRKVILDQMQDKLFDKMAWIPNLSIIYYRFYSCRIKNMQPTDYANHLTGIPRAWIDETGC